MHNITVISSGERDLNWTQTRRRFTAVVNNRKLCPFVNDLQEISLAFHSNVAMRESAYMPEDCLRRYLGTPFCMVGVMAVLMQGQIKRNDE